MNEELLNEFSNILKEKDININDLLSNLNSSNTGQNTSSDENSQNNDNSNSSENNSQNSGSSSFNPDSIDLSTLLKVKNLFDKYQKNNSQNVQLLMALKPFMKESRKSKIDQYAKMLKIAELFENFDLFGGEK